MKKYEHLEVVENMNEKHIPSLSVVTLAALELFVKEGLPKVILPKFKNPIIAGSGNAKVAAQILFSSQSHVLAEESDFKVVAKRKDVDGAIVFSASGAKHAPLQVQEFRKNKLDTYLVTCTKDSDASKFLDEKHVIVTSKNREPYTYNTSTYMGWLFALTGEDPKKIIKFIHEKVGPVVRDDLKKFKGYLLITPDNLGSVNQLFETKFIELFGRRLARDVKTYEELKHAITVVPYDKELCIKFGNEKLDYEGNIMQIPLPRNCGFAALMAIGYFVIGHIEEQNEQFFKHNIMNYCRKAASKKFGKGIKVIVE